jgi:hypothetical protein
MSGRDLICFHIMWNTCFVTIENNKCVSIPVTATPLPRASVKKRGLPAPDLPPLLRPSVRAIAAPLSRFTMPLETWRL